MSAPPAPRRDCLFFVADKNMQYAIAGFFERDGFHHSLGCAPFAFDARHDVIVAVGQNDPGIYSHAQELVAPFVETHTRIVVIVDAEWTGSPGADNIETRVYEHVIAAGWEREHCCVLVPDPEVDLWLWTDTPHTAAALGWESVAALHDHLDAKGFERNGHKPLRPKEAAESALRVKRIPRSAAIYREVASRVSLKHCVDPAVETLISALRRWFPA